MQCKRAFSLACLLTLAALLAACSSGGSGQTNDPVGPTKGGTIVSLPPPNPADPDPVEVHSFTDLSPAPALLDATVSDFTVATAGGGDVFFINGDHYGPTAAVTFDSFPSPNVTVVNSRQMIVTTPVFHRNKSVAVDLSITTKGETVTVPFNAGAAVVGSPGAFSYFAVTGTITSPTPPEGRENSPGDVTITGVGLLGVTTPFPVRHTKLFAVLQSVAGPIPVEVPLKTIFPATITATMPEPNDTWGLILALDERMPVGLELEFNDGLNPKLVIFLGNFTYIGDPN